MLKYAVNIDIDFQTLSPDRVKKNKEKIRKKKKAGKKQFLNKSCVMRLKIGLILCLKEILYSHF